MLVDFFFILIYFIQCQQFFTLDLLFCHSVYGYQLLRGNEIRKDLIEILDSSDVFPLCLFHLTFLHVSLEYLGSRVSCQIDRRGKKEKRACLFVFLTHTSHVLLEE